MSVTSTSHALKRSLYTSFVSLWFWSRTLEIRHRKKHSWRGLLSAPLFPLRFRSLIFPRRHGRPRGSLFGVSPEFTRKALLALFCDCDLVSPAARSRLAINFSCFNTKIVVSVFHVQFDKDHVVFDQKHELHSAVLARVLAFMLVYLTILGFKSMKYVPKSKVESLIWIAKDHGRPNSRTSHWLLPSTLKSAVQPRESFFKLTLISFRLMNVWNEEEVEWKPYNGSTIELY